MEGVDGVGGWGMSSSWRPLFTVLRVLFKVLVILFLFVCVDFASLFSCVMDRRVPIRIFPCFLPTVFLIPLSSSIL